MCFNTKNYINTDFFEKSECFHYLNTCDNCSVKLFTLRSGKKRSSRKSDNIFSGSVKRSEKNIKECPGLWHGRHLDLVHRHSQR